MALYTLIRDLDFISYTNREVLRGLKQGVAKPGVCFRKLFRAVPTGGVGKEDIQ